MEADANGAAVARAWLRRRLADLDDNPARSFNREWADFRREWDGRGHPIFTDWPSDFWIAQTERSIPDALRRGGSGMIQRVWTLPESLDAWPSLSAEPVPVEALPQHGLSRSRPMTLPPEVDPWHWPCREGDAQRRFVELVAANQE
jgi:hypothetical protein